MIFIRTIEDIRNNGFSIDSYIEQLVIDAFDRDDVLFINNKRQLIAKNDDTNEERILAVFA
jgi:hypothetical protein